MSDADFCRIRDWTPGTILEGDDSAGLSRIVITAVGEEKILARKVAQDGEPTDDGEATWTLRCRVWKRVG